jgi:hypothetical protein
MNLELKVPTSPRPSPPKGPPKGGEGDWSFSVCSWSQGASGIGGPASPMNLPRFLTLNVPVFYDYAP